MIERKGLIVYFDNKEALNALDKNIVNKLKDFTYRFNYTKKEIVVYDSINKIKMTGYLYQSSPSIIDLKYYFSSWTNSIPDATSTRTDTSTQSDQIWYETPL